MNVRRAWLGGLSTAAMALAGCNGDVVVSPTGGGGSASTSSSSSASSSSSSSSSSSGGPTSCEPDCAPGTVCVYATGTCAPSCDGTTPCGAGLVCEMCATGSCPGCDDCVAACLPAPPGHCDDHDDCAMGNVCVYKTGTCAPACDASAPTCPSGDLVCDPCATAPCPMCEACLGACTMSF